MKYTTTRSVNTNACKNHTNNSTKNTTIGNKNGTLNIAIAQVIHKPSNTIHASIFQNNLKDKDIILANSHISSSNQINIQRIISKIFKKAVKTELTSGTIHNHFIGKYLLR
ncbi:MAG: hypothetical protein ACOZBL_00620 [Patescibacteria group bacterium]